MVQKDEQGVFHLQGDLTIHDLESLRQSLMDMAYTQEELVLSFAEVSFMDTAVLQMLLAFRRSLPSNRSWLVVGVSEKMERILSLTGLRMALLGYGE